MRLYKHLSTISLILQFSLVQSRIYIDSSCEDIYSEVKTAVETALKWAATANDRIIAKDQATMTVANMLFDNIDDASSRLKKVVDYGDVNDGDAPKDLTFGDAVIYCNIDKWDAKDSTSLKYNSEVGFYQSVEDLNDIVDPNSKTMAMTSVAEKPGRPDAIIIGTKYQTELAEFGYLITPELIQRAKDGKRAESIMDNVILKTKGVTVVDVLASRLEHTILHELTHGIFAGKSKDVDKDNSYRWKNCIRLKSSTNAESLAFMRLVAWLITEEGVSVDKNGKLFTVGI